MTTPNRGQLSKECPVCKAKPRRRCRSMTSPFGGTMQRRHPERIAIENAAWEEGQGARVVAQIKASIELEQMAHDRLVEAVRKARVAGLSWADIGDIFGVSRQAAWTRFAAKVGEEE